MNEAGMKSVEAALAESCQSVFRTCTVPQLALHWQSNCFFNYLWMKDFCFFLGRVTKMRKMNVTSITNPAVIFREAASSCSMEERAG